MRTTVRSIAVDGVEYRWWIPRDSLYRSPERHVCIARSKTGQQLRLDPYAWEQEVRPGVIADVIRFALTQGWMPESAGPPIFVGVHEGSLRVLPRGVAFVDQLQR